MLAYIVDHTIPLPFTRFIIIFEQVHDIQIHVVSCVRLGTSLGNQCATDGVS